MLWRLPFGQRPSTFPPIAAEHRRAYPALQPRFDDLDRELVPAFAEHDLAALEAQRSYRRFQLALVTGAALTSFFGAVQAALGDGGRWAAAIVIVVGALTSYAATRVRHERLPGRYLVERAKAEELRSLYFDYLSGTGIAGPRALEARVNEIRQRKQAFDDESEPPARQTGGADDETGAAER